MPADYDVVIVGGGLAGLTSAIELSRNGYRTLLIEKKSYPYHKVCGEYVSNEVLPYLQSLGFDPYLFGAAKIDKLRISTPSGKNIHTRLDMGGFSLSRYTMDHALYELALAKGAEVMTNTRVTDIQYIDDNFTITTQTGATYTAKLVIGSYGKRETLDKKLNRDFVNTHTGYMGVKYHIRTDYPADEIGLDNFENGYCGISKIEGGEVYNLCYLYRRGKENYKSIPELEAAVLHKNPILRSILTNADHLYDAPLAINEISFAAKTTATSHILMCGDTAGLITPLCGNGMSMAIGAAKLLTGLMHEAGISGKAQVSTQDRTLLEQRYAQAWGKQFKQRLFWGRTIQGLLGNTALTGMFLHTVHALPPLERQLIRMTHGKTL